MTTAIEKLNEALVAITEEQKGLEGENLILSLKAIRNVVKAMETMAKMTKVEKVEEEEEETEVGNVESAEGKHEEEPPVEAVEEVKVEQEVEKSIEEVKAEKPAKWVFSKKLKLDTFDRMCEKAWADSGLQDESIKKEVYDELSKWYKMSLKSPWAGYMRYYKYRPHSNEELEKDMYEKFEMQFSKYDGYKGTTN